MNNSWQLTAEGEVLNEDQLELICGGYKNADDPVVHLVTTTAYGAACPGGIGGVGSACWNLFSSTYS